MFLMLTALANELIYLSFFAIYHGADYLKSIKISFINLFIVSLSADFLLLILFYFLAFRLIKKQKTTSRKYILIIILAAIIFSITLLLLPPSPMEINDIYNYIIQARMINEYGANPYKEQSFHYSFDPLYPYAEVFGGQTSVYGPLWLIISTLPNKLAKENIWLNAILFKFTAILFNLGCLYLIWKILGKIKPQFQILGSLIYAWNPFILWQTANNGHNDIVMVFFILLAIYLITNKKYIWVIPALILATLVKYVSLILIPFFLFYLLKNKRGRKEKIDFLIKVVGISLIFAVIIFIPFGFGNYIITGPLNLSRVFDLENLPPIPFLIFTLTNHIEITSFISILIFGLILDRKSVV